MGSIYLATLRNPALLASYQTSPGMLYGTPFATGMENYFQKIKAHFGQSMFDQLLTEFAQQSNLYVDEIKVDEWHIYGSSRLGVYETNRIISKRVARDLNNDNQITNNEYVIETPEEVIYLYSSYQLERGAKRYELTNHLGNVLTVISDKKTANFTGTTFTNFTAERISATDYSPFGAPLAGRTWNCGEYRFGFNSMEKDNEINGNGNAYDFGARICDPRLGRWLSVDPASIQYPMHSNYSFAANSSVKYYDKNGKFIGTLIGAAIGGVIAAIRGESVKAGIISGAVAGAVWDLAVGAIVISGGTATPAVLVAAGTMSGMAGDIAYQGMTKGLNNIDASQTISAGAIGGISAGLLGALAPKMARWLVNEKPKVIFEPLIESPIKIGGRIGRSKEITGYSNVERHLGKRRIDGYEFEDVDEMFKYGEDFFNRQGENIREFISKEGYIHRIDTKTQEYGVVSPEGIIETVMRVTPKPNSAFRNAEEYLQIQLDKNGSRK